MFKSSLTIACALFAQVSTAQVSKDTVALKYGAQYTGKRQDDAMQKWRSNRFGQFIHWGLYAIPGGVWKGKTYDYAAEFLKSSARIPTATWDSLMYQFNPKDFDAKAWAKMAKNMGVKYMTITTKHHEGFCLFPSKYTDFNIANTPYKKDILKEIIDAYNAEGIDVSLYYSVLDWHHPDWRYDIKSEADSVAFVRFLDFAKNQLGELATNYPTVKGFWFDGTWDNSIKKNGKWTYDVERMLKQIRPGVVVNSRLRADDLGKRHIDSNGKLMGDYESGYERRLPSAYTDLKVTKWDWEACMTVPENQWGYHKDWSISHVKTPIELLEMIVHSTSMGGNFLLNFGPSGEGTFRTEEYKIAQYIGKWMEKNSDVIVGCDYAGWEKQDWGYYTRKGNEQKVNAIVFNIPVSNVLKVRVPANVTIQKAYFKQSGKAVPVKEVAKGQYQVTLPASEYASPPVIIFETSGGSNTGKYRDALT